MPFDVSAMPPTWTAQCAHCGAPFTVRRAWAKRATIRCCSRACSQANRPRTVERTCEGCQVTFSAERSEVKRGNGRFCSPRCRYDHERPRAKRDPAERFWEKVVRSDVCWKWQPELAANGYGTFFVQGRGVGAHRAAWWLATGVWPADDQIVGHTCDVLVPGGDISYRACVRNDDIGTYEVDGVTYERRGHLWLGTSAANTADRDAKGRTARGESATRAKLTEAQVIEIRRLRKEGATLAHLALQFNIDLSAISAIARRITWKHLP